MFFFLGLLSKDDDDHQWTWSSGSPYVRMVPFVSERISIKYSMNVSRTLTCKTTDYLSCSLKGCCSTNVIRNRNREYFYGFRMNLLPEWQLHYGLMKERMIDGWVLFVSFFFNMILWFHSIELTALRVGFCWS